LTKALTIKFPRKLERILITVCLLALPVEYLSAQDYGTNHDLQSWNTLRITHPIDDLWSLSLQNELRFTDDISTLDEYIVKFYAHRKFSERFGLSFGIKYIDRPNGPNEWDPWAELVFPRLYNKWHISHQVRFETRLYSGLSGILPRARYLFNSSRQLGDTPWYVTGFGAVRFNMDEKGAGPVSGFEQVRLTANVGWHFNNFSRLELGYLYRYERSRNAADLSDNVIHLNLFFTTKPKPRRPMPNDNIR
jgi:hypothetical protein